MGRQQQRGGGRIAGDYNDGDMEDDGDGDGDGDGMIVLQPNLICYNTVLDAWARSNDSNACDRACTILSKMEDTIANHYHHHNNDNDNDNNDDDDDLSIVL